MKTKVCKSRTLALEIRLRRVGFAVFEGPSRLLDWGIRRWPAAANPTATIALRIDPLLSLYSPSMVVLKHVGHARVAMPRKRVIDAVRKRLIARPIAVHMVKIDEVRQAFYQSGNRNKYEIAAAIAQLFPELRRKLPPKRKAYQPERYNAVIFDAVALALTHRLRYEACIPPTNMEDS